MGMFDTVKVPCPVCKTLENFQSKSGDCVLGEYDLDRAPANVLMDVNRHSPYTCRSCGTKFEVEVKFIASAKSVIYKAFNKDSDENIDY